MLHTDDSKVRSMLLDGKIGLEKESLRVDGNGFMAHTPEPFPDDPHIVRDFSENQTEINTPAMDSPREALEELGRYTRRIQQKIGAFEKPEYLWPFSNPPFIKSEEDIPIARYYGDQEEKTRYREYLGRRYSRYKMTFSGIHFNYSFSDELLKAEFELAKKEAAGQDAPGQRESKSLRQSEEIALKLCGENAFHAFKDRFYVALAEKMEIYGWLMVAVTAASPLLDSSFVAKGEMGETLFTGLGSVRCSELGYWNFFTPILDYANLEAYADSILSYVDQKLIRYPSELYFPIRLKPRGKYDVYRLKCGGVSHIEMRMIDLNPFAPYGMDLRDVQFAQLLLVWAASLPDIRYDENDHVAAIQNFKTAAHYDLKTVKIVLPGEESMFAADAALKILGEMEAFYRDFPDEIREVIAFEKAKFEDGDNRYAWKVKKLFGDDFVGRGIELMKKKPEMRGSEEGKAR